MRRAGVVFFVAVALFATACSKSSGGLSPGDPTHPKEGEVFLEPLGDVGRSPFTPSVALAAVPAVEATSATGTSSSQGLRSVEGTASGLYAGSGSQQVCDAVAAVNSLMDHRDNAQAWVDALNTDPDLSWSGGSKLAVADIGAYVAELTSVFLQADTRVTNHTLAGNEARAFQSVLQRGTAVMVDNQGLPRARCASFGPLSAPKPAASPKYRGVKWTGFDEHKLVLVTAGASAETFRIVDVHTHEIIEITPGQGCACDRTKQASTTTTTEFVDETTTTSKTARTTTTIKKSTTTTGHPTTTVPATTTTHVSTTEPPTTETTVH